MAVEPGLALTSEFGDESVRLREAVFQVRLDRGKERRDSPSALAAGLLGDGLPAGASILGLGGALRYGSFAGDGDQGVDTELGDLLEHGFHGGLLEQGADEDDGRPGRRGAQSHSVDADEGPVPFESGDRAHEDPGAARQDLDVLAWPAPHDVAEVMMAVTGDGEFGLERRGGCGRGGCGGAWRLALRAVGRGSLVEPLHDGVRQFVREDAQHGRFFGQQVCS